MDSFLPFKISVCGIEELDLHRETGVSHVLSILNPDWPVPAAFGAVGEHTKLELRFHDVIEGQGEEMIAPQQVHVTDLLAFGRRVLSHPRVDAHLLVHCHAGVSRSTASMALILAQALPGASADRIFAEVLHIRPQAWPNLLMLELGDAALGRRGELMAAAADIYRTQLDKGQYFIEHMWSGGRSRDIEAAMRVT